MKIAEIFYSIQGEGKLSGIPSVFIRTSGCNLRCTWCDTPYASWNPEGEAQDIGQIVKQVQSYGAQHVVVTGGEPMIWAEVVDLCAQLKQRGHHITIETAATIYREVQVDLISMSPKLSNSTPWEREGGRFAQSHEKLRLNPGVIQQFIDHAPDMQLKFVVSDEQDLQEIEQILAQLKRVKPEDVQLMPEGVDTKTLAGRAGWIVELCKQKGYRFCPRLHVAVFGNKRGT